ncbi:proteasome subunit beta [Halorarum halophilum]|uniref:Proteasome subunit beta n=1 Tax=Halorarum halophilum TaxID=2743090 RepID=A0A7D5K6Q6_9EURY|nr:proteasome subunit beta [Halobaculum halophilum]QLG26939.1 proteasome subunit beta [Halobaculum halophilum]
MVQETEFGTTIVGLVADGRVVLASDRRASVSGMVSSKRADKVFPVGDRAALAFTGAVGDAQALVPKLETEVRLYETRRNERMSIPALATFTANTMRENPLRVQHVLGGVDADGPHLYTFDAAGGVLDQPYAADGSGGPTAYGVLESEYDDGLSVAEARSVAARAVAAASERDLASGDGLNVAVVDGERVDLDRYDDPAAVAS